MKAKIRRENFQKTDEFAGGQIEMSLYEMNQNFMATQPPLSAEEASSLVDSIIKEYTINHLTSKYFMLLCKDINYYTIFVNSSYEEEKFTDIILDCLKNVGQILSIELNKENNTPEIWVRTPEGKTMCMFYFECANLVVPFGIGD